MQQQRVTILILNYNGAEMLRRFLPQVIANTPTDIAKIIVADNASTDDSLSVLSTEFPQIDIIRLNRNYGFAEGYNRAMEHVDTPYTLLLNSDAAPLEGCIAKLVSFLDDPDNSSVAACQPKILSATDPTRFEYAGAAGGFLDRNGYPLCRGRIFGTVEYDHGQYDTATDIHWATGAALMIRTDLFKEFGGFPSDFFAHMEEIDLCWRLRRGGWRIVAVPQAKVIHLGGGTLSAASPQKTYLNFRNNLLLLYRNLPPKSRKANLLRRRLLDTLAWAKEVATLRWHHAAAILRAHRDFRRMAHPTELSELPTPDNLMLPLNIITSYYIRRKHTFSSLSHGLH